MPGSFFFALLLAALWGFVRIYHLLKKSRRTSPLPGVAHVPPSRSKQPEPPHAAESKSNERYQRLYFQLHNLEDHADVLRPARDELLAMFSEAITHGLHQHEHGRGIFSIKAYDPAAVWALVNDEHHATMAKWQTYLDRRKRGGTPALFGTLDAAKAWLLQRAPVKFVDGAWLAHINKLTTPFALTGFTKNAWQIFSEELGDGDLAKHHVFLYRELLADVGCHLPESHEEDFVHARHWEGLERPAWKGAVGQLLISLFPNEFLPEILGFNMHYELVTIETMQAAFELKALGLNPYYFLLHVAIDNADSGHAAMATHVVTRYLDMIRERDGEEVVAEAWRRMQVGYSLSQSLGSSARGRPQSQDPAFADVPLDPLSSRVSRIFKSKAAVSQHIHCQSRVRLGRRTLTEWLDGRTWTHADKNQELELLTALVLAKPWVVPGASSRSHLLREMGWNGRMYGAFTHEESVAIAAWIDSLGPESGAWMYWRFTGRKPVTSTDAVARLRDPAGCYPSMVSPMDPEETVIELNTMDFQPFNHQPKLPIEKGLPATLIKDRLPDLIALWFAHIGLVENTLNTPSRTTTPLYASLLRLRRAEAGFGLETDIVAGTDEMNRTSSPGLVDIGLDLISTAGWSANTDISCVRDVLDLTRARGQSEDTARLVHNVLCWSLHPVKNLGLLLGLSLAFVEMKTSMIDMPGLLSPDGRTVLEALVVRERQSLDECVQELGRVDEGQYRCFGGGYSLGRTALGKCFAKEVDGIEPKLGATEVAMISQKSLQADAVKVINAVVSSDSVNSSKPCISERQPKYKKGWVVQKFGGTSVGKFAVKIAEDIVLSGLKSSYRIAVVCSARSPTTKSQGTTSQLVCAARDVLDPCSNTFREIVEEIRLDHLRAGKDACSSAGPAINEDIFTSYSHSVNQECCNLTKVLEAAQSLRAVTDQTEDMVVSVGEKLSCLHMTALLQTRGVAAAYVDLSELITFQTGKGLDENFYQRLGEAIAERIHNLGPEIVPVITGYFGPVPGGLLKEVGRGYTDLCGALTAVGLKARELQVWKEVDGIFTADPRKVPTARLLDSVTPSEAAELTFYGSEVIHPFTMDQVIRARIPIRIKNVTNPQSPGTVVIPDPDDIRLVSRPSLFRKSPTRHDLCSKDHAFRQPTAVTVKQNITVLNVHSRKRTRTQGFLMNIFKILNTHHLSVDLISSSEVHVSMALHSERSLLSGSCETEMRIESAALQAAVDDLAAWGDVDLVPRMAIISLVGRQLKTMIGISGRFFSTLGENGINIEMISQGASEINISCVIDEADADRALNVVHASLFQSLANE